MTYFKLEQIKSSLYFEQLLKSILFQLDPRKRSHKELLEKSVLTDLQRSNRCIDNHSDYKQRTRKRGTIRKNFSMENFVETGGFSQNKSVFNDANLRLGLGKFIMEQDTHGWGNFDDQSRSSLDSRSDNADFYRVIVNKTSERFESIKEKKKFSLFKV